MIWVRPAVAIAVFTLTGSVAISATVPPLPPVPSVVRFNPLKSSPGGVSEKDHPAPVDYGFGPGVPRDSVRTFAAPMLTAGADAHVKGAFGSPFTWPIIPIHVVQLPDGRVLSYGSDETGLQGALLKYVVWDPAQGTGSNAFTLLNNATHTDVFCGGFSVMAGSGDVLLAGGNLTDYSPGGTWNNSIDATNIFFPGTNALVNEPSMTYKRWYPTLIGLARGELLVLGGRMSQLPDVGVGTPEIYSEGQGWRLLSGATSNDAYGTTPANVGATDWYYPRAALAPNGKVFVLTHDGYSYYVDSRNNGSVALASATVVPASDSSMPAVWYRPGKMLALRTPWDSTIQNKRPYTLLVSLTPGTGVPTFREGVPYDRLRYYSNLTVLADGQVALIGGSTFWNEIKAPYVTSYDLQLWNPVTETWRQGATAEKYRLYHSTAMLMPDATLFTGGGGAPGPTNMLNAEIYYPPYLFKKDGSGQLATRPTITSAPATITRGQTFDVQVGTGTANTIKRVSLVRIAGATHDYNGDQRFIWATSTQNGQTLSITPPTNRNVVPAAYYMLFAFNQAGVPSVAKIVKVAV
ncbi:MAG: galactose oxidase early set domain-containing protein [Methylotetracoccus sp.]